MQGLNDGHVRTGHRVSPAFLVPLLFIVSNMTAVMLTTAKLAPKSDARFKAKSAAKVAAVGDQVRQEFLYSLFFYRFSFPLSCFFLFVCCLIACWLLIAHAFNPGSDGLLPLKAMYIDGAALTDERTQGEGVLFVHEDVVCRVEELVLRHAARSGWCVP